MGVGGHSIGYLEQRNLWGGRLAGKGARPIVDRFAAPLLFVPSMRRYPDERLCEGMIQGARSVAARESCSQHGLRVCGSSQIVVHCQDDRFTYLSLFSG